MLILRIYTHDTQLQQTMRQRWNCIVGGLLLFLFVLVLPDAASAAPSSTHRRTLHSTPTTLPSEISPQPSSSSSRSFRTSSTLRSLLTSTSNSSSSSDPLPTSRSALFQPPYRPLPYQFLERDPTATRVIESTVSVNTVGKYVEFTFPFTKPDSEFMIAYVNYTNTIETSRGYSPAIPSLMLSATWTSLGSSFNASDVDLSYLASSQQQPFQSVNIYPMMNMDQYPFVCANVANTSCVITLRVTLLDLGNTSLYAMPSPLSPTATVPFRLTVVQTAILPWSTDTVGSVSSSDQAKIYGFSMKQDDLAVAAAVLPEQPAAGQSAHIEVMSYLFNAHNPIQYFSPLSTFTLPTMGDEIGMVMSASWSTERRDRSALENPTGSSVVFQPIKAGTLYADPNYGIGSFTPSLYLMVIAPTERSTPTPPSTTHNFHVVIIQNWTDPTITDWNSSTYGIIGALTLLTLCLLSCCIAFLRRRCSTRDEYFAAALRNGNPRSAANEADRPATDEQGRPIRYDANGRRIRDTGCKQEEIDALPIRIFVTGMIPEDDATCTICLGEYEADEKVKDLPCAHHFHSDCINKWLKNRNTCPNCNQPISNAKDVHHATSASPEEGNATNGNATTVNPLVVVTPATNVAGPTSVKHAHNASVGDESESEPLTARSSISPHTAGRLEHVGPAWCVDEIAEEEKSLVLSTAIRPSSVNVTTERSRGASYGRQQQQQQQQQQESKESQEVAAASSGGGDVEMSERVSTQPASTPRTRIVSVNRNNKGAIQVQPAPNSKQDETN